MGGDTAIYLQSRCAPRNLACIFAGSSGRKNVHVLEPILGSRVGLLSATGDRLTQNLILSDGDCFSLEGCPISFTYRIKEEEDENATVY